MNKPDVALRYLRENEWTMGNGQCHDCCGHKPRAKWWTDTVGHKPKCKTAKAIEALGGKVVWEHFNHSKYRRAHRQWWSKALNAAWRKASEKIGKDAK